MEYEEASRLAVEIAMTQRFQTVKLVEEYIGRSVGKCHIIATLPFGQAPSTSIIARRADWDALRNKTGIGR